MVGTGGALGGSGITTSTDQTVQALESLGHDAVRLVSGARLRRRPNRVNLENVAGVVEDSLDVLRGVRCHRPDLVWLHTFGVPTLPALRTLLQVMAARLGCRSVVVRFQAFALEDHVRAAGLVQRTALRAIGALSSRLVAEHEAAASALARFAPGRVVTLHNWVDVPEAPAPLPEAPPFCVVFIGGLIRRKGLPELLQAMRKVTDRPIVLRVVGGPGDDGAAVAEEIARSADDLVAAGSVELLGLLEPGQVRDELRRAHLFVLPSRAEGMPLAMLEALAEGRPVLVSDAGNMAEIVRGHGCGVVLAAVDADEIARQLTDLMDRPADVTAMGHRAHAAALQGLSASAMAGSVERILTAAAPGS